MMISEHVEDASQAVAISVVMATYNGERYLREQLDSIVNQLGPADELVISDDRSTDSTPTILREYESDRVRIISTAGRLGPIRNFEHGLRHARGQIIVLSDQDDKWLPGRIQRVRDHFAPNGARYDLLVMNSVIVDGILNPVHESLFAFLDVGPGLLKNLRRNTYVGCHMAFRRDLMMVAMPFPAAIPMHDMWLGLVSEFVGPVTYDYKPSMLFRRSDHNFTKAHYSPLRRITWRIGLAWSLLRLRLSSNFRSRPGAPA